MSLEHYRETSSACALFVCNKRVQVPSEETDEVKDHIVRKLKHCWPNVDPESQIIYMSSTTAREAQTWNNHRRVRCTDEWNQVHGLAKRQRKTVRPMEVSVLESLRDTIKHASVIFNSIGTS